MNTTYKSLKVRKGGVNGESSWKAAQRTAQRTAQRHESNRRAKLANLPDLKNQRDSELAAIQGIVKEFTKDGIQTDSVVIDLTEFGEVEEYPEY